jgi:hypothetical protein
MMNLANQLNQHRYLYLTAIGEPKENVLRLVIEEARASGAPQEVQLGEVVLSESRPIVADECCHAYEILFESYVAYSVRNECFVVEDATEEYIGRLFCVYSRSHFLDYVRVATFASEEYPGHLQHYGINCLNHIVDVVSVEEPTIRPLRRDGKAGGPHHCQPTK